MITIPETVWERMLVEFGSERRLVEQVCYLDGVSLAIGGVVTTLTFPNGRLSPQMFEVPPAAMSQAGQHFRIHKLRRLAQVHTHPGESTNHSPWDDAKAYSQMEGAVSIVLPHWGRSRPALAACGVHVRTAGGWVRLTPAQVTQTLRIVPGFLDFRTKQGSCVDERTRVKPPRRRPWWKAIAFWQHD